MLRSAAPAAAARRPDAAGPPAALLPQGAPLRARRGPCYAQRRRLAPALALQGCRLPLNARAPCRRPLQIQPNSCHSPSKLPSALGAADADLHFCGRRLQCASSSTEMCLSTRAHLRRWEPGSEEGAPPRRLARHLVCRNEPLICLMDVCRLQRRALPPLFCHSHGCKRGMGGSAATEGEGAAAHDVRRRLTKAQKQAPTGRQRSSKCAFYRAPASRLPSACPRPSSSSLPCLTQQAVYQGCTLSNGKRQHAAHLLL